ncbi:PIG-L family deacetylase [Adhaeribacter swui]|uniref:PIG-L family deacetylase n=1 Tax=Adhaeribacter swui TaxID=2086471 RepID=A0A7G7G9H5_9BACT|nr:PIG-L family deacetylase [Adhaeribacter swui]QNF33809.1 PIG-L family deacetylase [Adhaeribacter swui]
MRNVIVVAAHPDDEVLGVGGTILKHKASGDKVCWLIVTNIFEHQGFSKDRVLSRQIEIQKVAKELGVDQIIKLDFPTMSLSSSSIIQMVPKVSSVFNDFKPEIIYCHNRSDAHSDHRIIFDAVMACTKSFRYPFIKQVLMYETISETEFGPALLEKAFIPNYFIDISKFLNKKLDIMKIYESEIGEHPFPRSLKNIEALATYRGASVGVEYAESFQVIKYIDK